MDLTVRLRRSSRAELSRLCPLKRTPFRRARSHLAQHETHTLRYERLEQLLEACYPNTPLRPSPEELRELFKTVGGG